MLNQCRKQVNASCKVSCKLWAGKPSICAGKHSLLVLVFSFTENQASLVYQQCDSDIDLPVAVSLMLPNTLCIFSFLHFSFFWLHKLSPLVFRNKHIIFLKILQDFSIISRKVRAYSLRWYPQKRLFSLGMQSSSF